MALYGNVFQAPPAPYQPIGAQTATTGFQLLRVTGIEGAKAYPMQPNSTVALFDANEDLMQIKSTDAGNFPTIRKFEFKEIVDTPVKEQKYVTIEEFNKFKEEILNAKQLV